MKNGYLVSLALVAPAVIFAACGGGGGVDPGTTGGAGTNLPVTTGDAGTTGAAAGSTGGSTTTGGGGTTASGGAGTTAAAGTTGATVDCTMDPGASDNDISNFEDGTGSVLPNGGRNGGWYSYIDTATTCKVMPAPGGMAGAAEIPGGRCASLFAMHFSGMGCSVFGAGVGTDLAAPASAADAGAPATSVAKTPYDVSGYTGISFWSRADKGTSMRFKMPMTDDTKTTDGGNCVDSTTSKCSDDFGANIALTAKWIKHTVLFTTMKQEGWGKTFTWTPGHVTSIQFQVPVAPSFDVWIDDVAFVK